MKKTLVIIGAIALVFGSWIVSSRNSLVQLDENTNQAFSNIEADLQRRFDLIPNLVNTVKGAANFEQETFTEVTEARSAWANAKTQDEKIEAGNMTQSALSRLLVTVENYPELKATEAFRDLQVQLEGTENRINVSRKRYNEAAKKFNIKIRKFPSNIVANIFKFEKHELFASSEGAENAPEVSF